MGDPKVVFTTYSTNATFTWATTNTSGHAAAYANGTANPANTPFKEIKSDLVPRSETFSNGDYTVTDFDTVRTHTTHKTQVSYSNSTSTGTATNTYYNIRSTLGTFALEGGQYELLAFDTGSKGGAVAEHITKSGVSHNYVAFANSGDGNNLEFTIVGTATNSSAVFGPPTAYAPDRPYSNIEFDVSHTTTPLQAIAGGGDEEANGYSEIYVSGRSNSGTENPDYYWNIRNVGGRSGTSTTKIIQDTVSSTDSETGMVTINYVRRSNTHSKIIENWYPQASYNKSTSSTSIHRGAIKFRVHPDSEYKMETNMVATNVAVSSVTIAASAATGPIATHSEVTVTTSSPHGLTDEQNQIVISGSDNPTHINGLHNVHSVSNTTVFTYHITKSTRGTETAVGDLKLQTYDGIDKTGAILKAYNPLLPAGTGIAEIVHGGCAGNNTVLLRGDCSANISLGTPYYVYSSNNTAMASTPIATVKFTSGPVYKSMFKEAGLRLNEITGQISSNGAFSGNLVTDNVIAGGLITLEDASGKDYGTEFILNEDGYGGKFATEDYQREVTEQNSGLRELDKYFYKFANARDKALNSVKTDGTITQENDTVTIQGVHTNNFILLENGIDYISTENAANTDPSALGYYTIGLEEGSKTFPTSYATSIPPVVFLKTLTYQNGFTVNCGSRISNSEFKVSQNTTINLTEGTADGQTYQLDYVNKEWPTPNSSSYWFKQNIDDSPILDSDNNILIFKTTSEANNTKVHFTIRAQKVHEHMDVYTGAQGSTNAASVQKSIDGWGDPFETGTGNYYDGYFYISVYNSTDSDRDDQVMVWSDQNNASSNTLNINDNSFKHRDDPTDPATEISITNAEALTNAYSNGDFTLLTSI